jgi:hypothetical protein
MPPLSVVPSSRQHTGTAIVSRHVEQKLGKQPTLKSSRYHKGGTSCMSSMEKSYFIPLSPTERYASICKITHAKCSWFRKISFKKIVYSHWICKRNNTAIECGTHKIRVELIMNGYTVFEKIHEYLLGLYHMHNRMYPRRGEHSAGRSDTSRQKTSSSQRHSACLLAFLIPVRESNGEGSDCRFLSIKWISIDDGKKHWNWHARLHVFTCCHHGSEAANMKARGHWRA